MGRVRLRMAAALAAVAALAVASAVTAQPEASQASGLPALTAAVPSGWRSLPGSAAAMTRALAEARLAPAWAGAWGDPARRCYAVAARLEVEGKVRQVVAGLRLSLAPSAPAPAEGSAEQASATLRLALGGELGGELVAKLRSAGPRVIVHALVCAEGDRFPRACQEHCARLAAALEAP